MKDQNVIALYDSPQSAAIVLPWARHFADRLNHKGIVELHLSADTDIAALPLSHNAILAVTAVDPLAPRSSVTNPHSLLRLFKTCKTAYLCVNKYTTPETQHTTLNTALTLTHRREGKEKLVWASYLARFLGSSITIAHPDYRDPGLQQLLHNNIRFVDKIFRPLNLNYSTITLKNNHITQNTDITALEQLHPSLLISRTSDPRDRDLLDLLTPLPEHLLLRHPSHTPILFLNPRDDLYILCD